MKKTHAMLAGLMLLLTALSCRKDLEQNQTEATPTIQPTATVTATATVSGVSESEWQKDLSWTYVERPTRSIFYTNIKADISEETAEKGLVRVFKFSDSGAPQSLPFEETVNGQKNYWYYQVTEGNIMISVDVYGSKNNPATSSLFKSVVLSKDAVANFETQGKTRAKLMAMPVEAMTSNK
jgi:hypothetical protein